MADPSNDAQVRAGRTVRSANWDGSEPPDIAVHVATYNRSHYLRELLGALAGQDLPVDRFEVVIVDNGSTDDTWERLVELLARSDLRLAVHRLPENRGPAPARNRAVSLSTAPLLAFTDDDCLAEPAWLSTLLAGFASGDVVQGRTEVGPADPGCGPWARTIRIAGASPLFETCNIAYRRCHFAEAGGFDEDEPLSARPGGRAFGEDALLGAAVADRGARHVYEHDAVVLHRKLPASFGDHLREMRSLAGFPALARRSGPLRQELWYGSFLTARSAAFDLAVAGSIVAIARRRPWPAVAAALPWLAQTVPLARNRGGRSVLVRLGQLAVADAVALASLAEGSVRHHRLLL